jgi:hypothetical protein
MLIMCVIICAVSSYRRVDYLRVVYRGIRTVLEALYFFISRAEVLEIVLFSLYLVLYGKKD